MNNHLSRTYIAICFKPPIQEDDEQSWPSLLGVAPNGVYTAQHVTMPAVSSYLAFSSLPRQSKPCGSPITRRLFSVALSLRFPSQDVILHHCSMEPGLSSYAAFRPCYTRLFNLLKHFLYFTIFHS